MRCVAKSTVSRPLTRIEPRRLPIRPMTARSVLVRPAPLVLVRDGRIIHKNMHDELLTEEELLGQLRQQGIEHVEDVKVAHIESSGVITAIPHEDAPKGEGKKERPRAFAPFCPIRLAHRLSQRDMLAQLCPFSLSIVTENK